MNKKLEIGEANPRFEGWDSVSLPEFNIILSDLPYEDGSLNEVYWSHVLEHIPYCNIESVVTGIYNKLETGGKFRTVCPDMRKIVEAYMNDDISQFERGKNHWGSLSLRGIYPKLGVGGMMMSQFIGSEKVDAKGFTKLFIKFGVYRVNSNCNITQAYKNVSLKKIK